MRKQRLAGIGLVLGVSAITVGIWVGGTALAQPAGQPTAVQPRAATPAPKIATLDVFAIAEKMMNREELTKPRNDLDAQFRMRMEMVEKEFEAIETRLRAFQNANDPQVQALLQQRQQKAEEYQAVVQQRQQEIEKLNASQLADIYASIRTAARRIAQERGYTHLMANRSEARAVQSNTVADALQDMLARPLIMTPDGDDLTQDVAAALNVDLTAAAEPQPSQPTPGGAPGQTPPGGPR